MHLLNKVYIYIYILSTNTSVCMCIMYLSMSKQLVCDTEKVAVFSQPDVKDTPTINIYPIIPKFCPQFGAVCQPQAASRSKGHYCHMDGFPFS